MGLAVGIPRASAISGSRIRTPVSAPFGRIRLAARRQRCRGVGRYQEACHLPHVSSFFRHPPARGRIRHPDDPGITGSSGRQYHDDLHPCLKPWWSLRTKSNGHPPIKHLVAYHHPPYSASPQPTTPTVLSPFHPTHRSQADSRLSRIPPDITRLPIRTSISPANPAPPQPNLSSADRRRN